MLWPKNPTLSYPSLRVVSFTALLPLYFLTALLLLLLLLYKYVLLSPFVRAERPWVVSVPGLTAGDKLC